MRDPLPNIQRARSTLATTLGLLVLLLATAAAAERGGRRVALVIGNGTYRSMTRLVNPGNDAQEIGTKLETLGFEVQVQVDRDKRAMEKDLAAFYKQGQGATLALFFYAGHGIQVDGRNYLLPVDAEPPEDEAEIHQQAVELEYLVRQVQRKAQASLIFLDACRNNPGLAKKLRGATRDVFRDLRLAEVPRGTVLVLYATSGGTRALDDVLGGKHSPFAAALLSHLGDPTAVQLVATRVIGDVMRKTDDKQRPEMQGNLAEEIVLAMTAPTGSPPAAKLQSKMEGKPFLPEVKIEGGEFLIGSTDADSEIFEKPTSLVTVREFFIDRYEVTVAAYRACVKAGICSSPRDPENRGSALHCTYKLGPEFASHPINCIDHAQALRFCEWVDKRLPTEEEWEYAARGSAGHTFPWGDNRRAMPICWFRVPQLHCLGGTDMPLCPAGIRETEQPTCAIGEHSHPTLLGSFNPSGIYDLGGNVSEWTAGPFCNHKKQDCNGLMAVAKGGDWTTWEPRMVRAARRIPLDITDRLDTVGFRCARTIQ